MRSARGLRFLALALAVACGTTEAPSTISVDTADQRRGGRRGVDWERPIPGDPVQSFDEAQRSVAFQAREPQGLGSPVRILVTPGEPDGSKADRAIAFIYDTSAHGRIVMVEAPDELPVAAFEAQSEALIAQYNNRPGFHGSFETVTIKGNIKARVITSATNYFTVAWRESNRVFTLGGPSIDKESLIKLAENA